MRIAGETRPTCASRPDFDNENNEKKTESIARRREKEGRREREKEILSQPYRNNSRIPRGRRLRVLRSPGLVRERGDTSRRYTRTCIFDSTSESLCESLEN